MDRHIKPRMVTLLSPTRTVYPESCASLEIKMDDKQIALAELPMLVSLPPDLKKLVMDCFVHASFSFGGDIVTEGEDPDAVYVLAEGRARTIKRAASGEEIPQIGRASCRERV